MVAHKVRLGLGGIGPPEYVGLGVFRIKLLNPRALEVYGVVQHGRGGRVKEGLVHYLGYLVVCLVGRPVVYALRAPLGVTRKIKCLDVCQVCVTHNASVRVVRDKPLGKPQGVCGLEGGMGIVSVD